MPCMIIGQSQVSHHNGHHRRHTEDPCTQFPPVPAWLSSEPGHEVCQGPAALYHQQQSYFNVRDPGVKEQGSRTAAVYHFAPHQIATD